MLKKGDILKMYSKYYIFYLERKDETTGIGPILKYGRKGKSVSTIIDLSQRPVDSTEGANGVLVIRHPTSRRKFKIITEEIRLLLKADTLEE